MSWAANTGKGTMRGMEAPIELTGIYPIIGKNILKLMILIAVLLCIL